MLANAIAVRSTPACRPRRRARSRPEARAAASRLAPTPRPRGRSLNRLEHKSPEADAEKIGVIWLDCCGRSVEDALVSLRGLVDTLEGDLVLLDRGPTFAVAQVRMARESFMRFRGAMALAGGMLLNDAETDSDREAVFILSQS